MKLKDCPRPQLFRRGYEDLICQWCGRPVEITSIGLRHRKRTENHPDPRLLAIEDRGPIYEPRG